VSNEKNTAELTTPIISETPPNQPWKAEKQKGRKTSKIIRLVIVLVILAIIGFLLYPKIKPLFTKKTTTVQPQRTSAVTRGNISVSVTGSGPLEPAKKMTVTSEVNSTIKQILHQNGDTVKAGDILFTLDDTTAKANVSTAENNLTEANISQGNTYDNIASLMVRAPFSGRVALSTLKVDDSISKGGVLLTITDESLLKIVVPFGKSDAALIMEGQKVQLTVAEFTDTIEGTVAFVGDTGYTDSTGGDVVDVEISVRNPGALKSSMTATAEIDLGTVALTSQGSGPFEFVNTKQIRSDAGGTITSISVRNNDTVKSGSLLLTLKNDDLSTSARTAETKISSLTNALNDANTSLSNCIVKAPMDGVVTGITTNPGDSAKIGTALCSVLDTTTMSFDVAVDELDINAVSAGQKVSATLDAVPESSTAPFSGTVKSIAVEGSSSNGVTTYPVTLQLSSDKRLKIGMNADASILVKNSENVLMVPLEAVQTISGRSFVFIKGNGTTQGALGFGRGMPTGSGVPDGSGVFNPQNQGTVTAGSGNGTGTNGAGSGNGTGQNRRNRSNGAATGTAGTGNDTSGTGTLVTGTAGSGGAAEVSGNGTTGTGNASGGFGGGSRAGRNTSQGGVAMNSAFAKLQTLLQQPYYAGAVPVPVVVGINNTTQIEIVSGLTEGAEVILPPLTTSATTKTTTTQQSGFGIPGMGGAGGATRNSGGSGAPAGGFPRD
jgi:HlyD family secretion protein